jgi:hypothetical protein
MELETFIYDTAELEAELANFCELEVFIISDSELESLLN